VAIELAHWHIGGSSDKTELLRNDGFPGTPFVRPGNETTGLTREHILSWNEGDLGGLVADFDNDGRLDVLVLSSDYPGTYALLWQNQGGGAFAEVGETAGVRVDRAHGGAAVDYDRDGDLDLVIGSSLMRWSAADNPPAPERQWMRVLRNDTGHAANKLALRFAPPAGSNRDAIGARVTVRAGGRTLLREVQGPYGLQGFQHDPVLYVGLGSACVVDEVEVRWPDAAGTVTTFGGVRPNELVTLAADGSAVYAPLPLAVDTP